MNILHLDSSAQGAASVSRSLTSAVVAALRQGFPDARVRYRDLAIEPLPAVSGELLQILRPQPGQTPAVSPALRVEVEHAEALLAEFLAADTVVIGAPMYNFAVPSALKAWIDRVVLPGRTFSYTAAGPKGLAGGKRVIVASTRGSRLVGASYETFLDHQEAYLKAVFSFIGIDTLTFVRAEGLSMGPESRDAAIAGALKQAADMASATT